MKVKTDPDTGRSHGLLTKTHRQQIANSISICRELGLIESDPRAERARQAAGILEQVLRLKELGADAPPEEEAT